MKSTMLKWVIKSAIYIVSFSIVDLVFSVPMFSPMMIAWWIGCITGAFSVMVGDIL